MIFACQKDSYLKHLTAKVTSCEPSILKVAGDLQIDGYDVILDDTILFPEGGGQPHDKGSINGHEVLQVRRDKNGFGVHFLKSSQPLTQGSVVSVEVNWNRRFDHMQQHSAQHLITAVAEDHFELSTTSWMLGHQVSNIELDSQNITQETIDSLEEMVNEKIRLNVPVTINLYGKESDELKGVRTRLELPQDHEGLIRVIRIEGIDCNTCCGTHVSNLSHLQMIKFLNVEKGKKGKSLLYFLAGNRVLNHMSLLLSREKMMTTLLKNSPEDHFSLVQKMQKNLKTIQKSSTSVVRELAQMEAEKFMALNPKPGFYCIHRKGSPEMDFINVFISNVKSTPCDTLFFLSVSDEPSADSSGKILLYSSQKDLLEECVQIVSVVMESKGVLKGNSYSGRVTCFKKKTQAENTIRLKLKQ